MKKALLSDGIYENVQMPNTFPFCRPSSKCSAGWIYFLCLPSCSFSLNLSTPRLLFAPPHTPGGTENLQCWYSRPHRWAALLWWKSECVESLVELHCMYCIYGIKIVFCSSAVCSVSALPSGGSAQALQAALQNNKTDTWVGKKKPLLFICKYKYQEFSFQCARPPVCCFH